jgi:hypothetical protein
LGWRRQEEELALNLCAHSKLQSTFRHPGREVDTCDFATLFVKEFLMVRSFVLAAVAVALTFSVALSENHTYKVSKIAKSGDNYVLTVTSEGTFDKDAKKMEWKDVSKTVSVPASTAVFGGVGGGGGGKGGKGGAGGFGGFGGGKGLEDGFANKMFETVPDGGFQISITTADADVKKGDITRITVTGATKKKKDAN